MQVKPKVNTGLIWRFLILDGLTCFRMLLSWFQGKYQPTRLSMVILATGLTYLVFIADFIPDFIPVLGWLDDLTVGSLMLHLLKQEIRNFRLSRKA